MDFGICVCGHEIEDHVSEGGHCTVPGCLCTWFQADDTPPFSDSSSLEESPPR